MSHIQGALSIQSSGTTQFKKRNSMNRTNHPLFLSDQSKTLPSVTRRNKSLSGATTIQFRQNESALFSDKNEAEIFENAIRQTTSPRPGALASAGGGGSPMHSYNHHKISPKRLSRQHQQQFHGEEIPRKVPHLAITPTRFVSGFEDDTEEYPNLMSPTGAVPGGVRLKFLPQTNVNIQRKQGGITPDSKPSLPDMTLLYSLKKQNLLKRNEIHSRKKSLDIQSLQGGMDVTKIQLAQQRAHLHTKAQTPIPPPSAPSEPSYTFKVFKKRPKLADLTPPEVSPLRNLSREEHKVLSQNSRREKGYLETINDNEESKERLRSKGRPIPSRQVKSETISLYNQDLSSYMSQEGDGQRRTPVHRKISPLSQDSPFKRSFEKTKTIGFVLPNGAKLKIKKELKPLLKAMAQEKGRKYYSPSNETQDQIYDMILIKDSLQPVRDEIPPDDVILSSRHFLQNITRGSLVKRLREIEHKHIKTELQTTTGGDDIITLGTDFDGASTDSEQPNIIGPLYHKHQPRMSITGNRIHSKDAAGAFSMYKTTSGIMDTFSNSTKLRVSPLPRVSPHLRKTSLDMQSKIASGHYSPRLQQIGNNYSQTVSTNAFPAHMRTLSMYSEPKQRRASIVIRGERGAQKIKNLKTLLQDREQHQKKRIEMESEISVKMDVLMKRFVNIEIKNKFNLKDTQFSFLIKLFKKLCLATIKQLHGFLRQDVTHFGILPKLLCSELQIPIYLLVGMNPVYKNNWGDALVTWMDFAKLMSILFFKSATEVDTLVFILKVSISPKSPQSLCLTRPQQFTKYGLHNAIRKAVHHSFFPYPDEIAHIWKVIYEKLVGIKSLYIDMTAMIPEPDQKLPETPKSTTSRPQSLHIPDAGIIHHKRLFRDRRKQGLIGESFLSLDIEAAALFLVGFIDSVQLRTLVSYLLSIKCE